MVGRKKTATENEGVTKEAAMSPWDYIKSFSKKTGNHLDANPDDEKSYPAFIVNRALSMSPVTVSLAAVSSSLWQLPPKMQHDFLYHIFPKGNFYSGWLKKDEGNKQAEADLEMIKDYFLCSAKKAAVILSLMDEEYKQEMRNMYASVTKKRK